MTLAELRELYSKLTGEARQLNNAGRIDEAAAKLEERKKVQRQIDIEEELEKSEKRNLKAQQTMSGEVNEMRSVVAYALGKRSELSDEERAIIKTSDNAALIPEPILKEIEVQKGYKSLKGLCTIRPVTASKGTIPVIDLDQNEMQDVTEGDDLVDGTLVSTEVNYKCINAGLIQQLTTDLIDDATVEIEGIVKHNFVNIATIKENKKILNTVDTNAAVVEGTSYKDVELELAKALPSNKAGLVLLVNPKAYSTLKTARDKNDRSLNLITNINGQEYAFGTCPIHGFDNGLVADTDEKELYYILDMKEAIQFVERKGVTILRDTNIKKMGAPVIAVGEKFDVVKGSARSIKKIVIGGVES